MGSVFAAGFVALRMNKAFCLSHECFNSTKEYKWVPGSTVLQKLSKTDYC